MVSSFFGEFNEKKYFLLGHVYLLKRSDLPCKFLRSMMSVIQKKNPLQLLDKLMFSGQNMCGSADSRPTPAVLLTLDTWDGVNVLSPRRKNK